MTWTLGVSAFYHDSAAAIVRDGAVIAAAQEERFTRVKGDRSYPRHAVAACLDIAGIQLADVDRVAYYESPRLKLRRQLETQIATAPFGYRAFSAMARSWLDGSLLHRRQLLRELSIDQQGVDWQRRLDVSEHHVSHAAAAFYPSPFEEAAILTIDAVGERATAALSVGRGSTIDVLSELHFPHSLGMFYSAFTQYLGFRVNSGEYKMMGLAPYGEPRFADVIRDQVIDVKPDGSFRLDMALFDYARGLRMTNERFAQLFGGPARSPEEPIEDRHLDIAASVQLVTTEIIVMLARHARHVTGLRHLCLAGGVALNCVANGALLREEIFDDLWIQPAAGDSGSALGAALWSSHRRGQVREVVGDADAMHGSYLGPEFAQDDVERRLTALGARFSVLPEQMLLARTADAIANGLVVGWFQGRMEFGPRALGARSILADARRRDMQRTLNLKIKYREGFRPFAPAVLADEASSWFDLDRPSPYMLLVSNVAEARRSTPQEPSVIRGLAALGLVSSDIPAVTHVDNSARVQTVDGVHNPRFHALLSTFQSLTGCPVVVNTSMNVRGEPIVSTPEDAFQCFMGTDMDVLVIENCMLVKDRQRPELQGDYHRAIPPD